MSKTEKTLRRLLTVESYTQLIHDCIEQEIDISVVQVQDIVTIKFKKKPFAITYTLSEKTLCSLVQTAKYNAVYVVLDEMRQSLERAHKCLAVALSYK